MGNVSYMIADLYESSRKQFKEIQKNTSRRLYSANREPIKLQDTKHKKSLSGDYPFKVRGHNRRHCFRKRIYNRKMVITEMFDESLLVESRQWTTVRMVFKLRQALYSVRTHISSPDIKQIRAGCQFKLLAKLLEEEGFSSLLNLLKGEAKLLGIRKDILLYFRIHLSISANVSAYQTFQLSQNPLNRDGRKGVLV